MTAAVLSAQANENSPQEASEEASRDDDHSPATNEGAWSASSGDGPLVSRYVYAISVAVVVVGLMSTIVTAVLLHYDIVFGADPRRFARAFGVAMTFAAFVAALRIHRARTGHRPSQDAQSTLLAALTVLAALYGLAGLAFPSEPASATPDCGGVPPASGRGTFEVLTSSGGINVRDAPSITATQLTRLPGGCGLAIDGFCLGGTAIRDAADRELVDSRWFRLHRIRGNFESLGRWLSNGAAEERFIAVGAIDQFVSDDLIARLDDDDCAGAGYVGEPGPATLTIASDEGTPEQPVFEVTADNTFEFGFSLLIMGDTRTGNPFRKIPTVESPDEVTRQAEWIPAATANYITAASDVVIFGGRCLAIGAPLDPGPADGATLAYRLEVDGTIAPIGSLDSRRNSCSCWRLPRAENRNPEL